VNKYIDRVRNYVQNKGKVTVEWTDLQQILSVSDYSQFTSIVKALEEDGIISPYGTKFNGRKPALYLKYKVIKEEINYTEYLKEIDYVLSVKLNKSYYRNNIKSYIRDREDILKINEFLMNNSDKLNTSVSQNERSFQIFKKEKHLKKSKTIFKNLGIDMKDLNFYETSEPIAYYSANKDTPQNVLIVENKDTFYTIRKYMRFKSLNILGINISTVVYGGGKSKIPSVAELYEYTESHIVDKNNVFLYFGDIDYEGIVIYNGYKDRTAKYLELIPFVPAYKHMIDLHFDNLLDLPFTKEGQNRNIGDNFFKYFSNDYKEKILTILKNDKYIPQEAISYDTLLNYKESEN
jgi:hypothetical protein